MRLKVALVLFALVTGSLPAQKPADKPADKPTDKPADKPVVKDPKPKKANRLARETSPYLLQHAHNPVDWYPWGDEAFAKAKKEKRG